MRTKMMLAFFVLALLILNYNIYKKEQIKRHGTTVLLELAPVDPRSLMQGDYMALDYAIGRDAPHKELASHQKRGYMVIQPDENNVAQFVRFHAKETLNANERLLHFHKDSWRIRIVPNSFFFQEGHAQYYENAQYGVFKFNDTNQYLLVGLADEDRKTISPVFSKTSN